LAQAGAYITRTSSLPNRPSTLTDNLLPAALVGHVLRKEDRRVAGCGNASDYVLPARRVDIGDDYRCALARERLRAGRSDTRRTTGNNCNLSLDLPQPDLRPEVFQRGRIAAPP
jgi:hypothetical protein